MSEAKRLASRRYYYLHREQEIARVRAYQKANPEVKRRADMKWRGENNVYLKKYFKRPEVRAQKSSRLRAWNTQRREAVLRHYSGGEPRCMHCGITDQDVLTIDHINGGGRKHRESIKAHSSAGAFYGWLIRNGYPAGFQILCANCNLKKYKLEVRQRFRLDGGGPV